MTKVLCTICARGGSKGVPNKNIRVIGDKTLVEHAIEDAQRWGRADDIVVSTDSEKIRSVAEEHGGYAPFERPNELASDEAAKLPVIQHAVEWMEQDIGTTYDYIVDIDATTPLRQPEDIANCYSEVIEDEHTTNAYTVQIADKNPYFNLVELDEDGYASLSKEPEDAIVRRQGTPAVYAMNAAVYVYERDFMMKTDSVHGEFTRVTVMPPERSVDIDSELDLRFVEFLVEKENIDI